MKTKSLLFQIFLLLFIVLLLPLLVFSNVNYQITHDKLTKNLISASQDDCEKASYHFMVELGQYFNISYMIAGSSTVKQCFQEYYSGQLSLQKVYDSVSDEIAGSQYFRRVGYPFEYILIAQDNAVITRYNHSGNVSYQNALSLLPADGSMRTMDSSATLVFQSEDYTNVHGGDKVYIAKNIQLEDDRTVLLLVGTDRAALDRLMDNYLPHSTSSIFVCREQELIAFGSTNHLTTTAAQSLLAEQDDGFIINEKTFYFSDTPKTPWTTFILTPTGSIGESIRYIKTIAYILSFFCVITVIVLFFAAKKTIFDRIVRLNHAMQQVEQGDLDVSLPHSSDEIGALYQGFNAMTASIKKNQQKALAEEKERTAIELVMLQSQITPHFMRNTLNVIRWMAEMVKAEGVARAIVYLTRLLDYNIREFPGGVTIQDELANIGEYMYIQQLRFGNTFTCHIQVEDALLTQPALKLLLQPIVENAIAHGFRDLQEVGVITILGTRKGPRMELVVQDNGSGMTPEQLSTILQPNQAAPHGVCVTIQLPYKEALHESDDR